MPKNEKPSGWNFACAALRTCASALLFSPHAGVAGAAVAACGAGACADAATGRISGRGVARTRSVMVPTRGRLVDRKSGVSGKRGAVAIDQGGRRIIQKKQRRL